MVTGLGLLPKTKATPSNQQENPDLQFTSFHSRSSLKRQMSSPKMTASISKRPSGLIGNNLTYSTAGSLSTGYFLILLSEKFLQSKLRGASFGVRDARCGVRVTGFGVRVVSCVSQVSVYGLRVLVYAARIASCTFQVSFLVKIS